MTEELRKAFIKWVEEKSADGDLLVTQEMELEELTADLEMAFEAGAKEGGVKWHDLRKNLDDLPTDESDVLCYLGRDESEVGYFHQEKKQFFTIDGKEINPVAWKEIHYPQESE